MYFFTKVYKKVYYIVFIFTGYIKLYPYDHNDNYFIYSSEEENLKADEAEEVRSGDEEMVEAEEEPEGP